MMNTVEVRGRTELATAINQARYAGDETVEITAVRECGGITRFRFSPNAWKQAEYARLLKLRSTWLRTTGKVLGQRMTNAGLEVAYIEHIDQVLRNLKKTPERYWD